MTPQETRVKKILKEMEINKLIDLWESTIENNDSHIPTVRGWIMDELEIRNPIAFNQFIDEYKDDKELRKYYIK